MLSHINCASCVCAFSITVATSFHWPTKRWIIKVTLSKVKCFTPVASQQNHFTGRQSWIIKFHFVKSKMIGKLDCLFLYNFAKQLPLDFKFWVDLTKLQTSQEKTPQCEPNGLSVTTTINSTCWLRWKLQCYKKKKKIII